MNIKTAVDNAQLRFVQIETASCSGSGVVIATSCVMTCFHCLHVNSGVEVNGEKAEVIAVDPEHDLCLLTTKTVEVDNIRLGDSGVGRHVLTVGNPLHLAGALLFGQIIWESDKRIITDQHCVSGISGAGLYNFNGELCGIIHSVMGMKHIGAGYGVALPAPLMQNILGTVFHIVHPSSEDVQKYGNPQPEGQEG